MSKFNLAHFPLLRARRLRQSEWIRELVAETKISASDLIWPVFVVDGKQVKQEIPSMKNVFRMSIDVLLEECKILVDLGLKALAIFPVIPNELKNDKASEAINPENLCCRAISEVKRHFPHLGVIADVALDPFTSSGHDGLLGPNGEILNDETIEILVNQALCQASAGADILAPSDMMDGRILEIRTCLEKAAHQNVILMSYAAKFASAFYSPFRDAVGSAKFLKNSCKKTYQMDFRNAKEAMKEIQLDANEGADILMVKPAGAYLDIIYQASISQNLPIFAYQVSGEFAMLSSMPNFENVLHESLIAIKRAGASAIFSYATPFILKNNNFSRG